MPRRFGGETNTALVRHPHLFGFPLLKNSELWRWLVTLIVANLISSGRICPVCCSPMACPRRSSYLRTSHFVRGLASGMERLPDVTQYLVSRVQKVFQRGTNITTRRTLESRPNDLTSTDLWKTWILPLRRSQKSRKPRIWEAWRRQMHRTMGGGFEYILSRRHTLILLK